MKILGEMKRRNVFRVGIAYIVAGWMVVQLSYIVAANLAAPAWVMGLVITFVVAGFPIMMYSTWFFGITTEGIRKESDIRQSPTLTRRRGRRLDAITLALLAMVVGMVMLDRFMPKPPSLEVASETTQAPAEPEPEPVIEENSIAVLPFTNMSAEANQEYFSDGLSEELLNVLVRVKGLRVPSRTSSFTFKGSSLKLSEIGKELQVDHILEGSVRKSGDRIRVTAQLIEVNTDTHLWSDTYTRQLDDIFAVQDEIAQAIVAALKITLNGSEQSEIQSRSTTNADAYNKYLLGRHLWTQRSPTSLLASIEPLHEAVALPGV